MAHVYKLTYFNFMGIGEPIRYIMSYGGVNYENVVVKLDASWTVNKKNYPFGKLPVMEVDGKMLFQSLSISRFLAKQFDLTMDEPWMDAWIDAIAESVHDLGAKVVEWHHEKNPPMKKEMQQILKTATIPTYMMQFEEYAKKNNGYFGGKLSWVDLYFVAVMESIEGMWEEHLMGAHYPHLQTLMERVAALPAIKAYKAKRPHYEY